MNWKYVLNPFAKYSEKQLFIVGIIGFIVMNIFCILAGNKMNGILHWDDAGRINKWNILILNTGIMFSTIVIFYVFGKIINRNTRFIDVANAFLLAMIPSLLVSLVSEIPALNTATENLGKITHDNVNATAHPLDLLVVGLCALVALPLVGYIIILMFNGFKTATNMKKTWQIVAFFIILFVLNSITQSYF